VRGPALAAGVVLGLLLALLGGCENKTPEAVRAADELFRQGRQEAAASAYARLPEEAEGWRPYGAWRAAVIYRDALRDPVRAERAYEECSSRFPTDTWGYSCQVDLGDLRRDGRRFRAAINSYRAALEQRPRGRYAEHCMLESGRSYLSLGEYEQARIEWKELEREFPASRMLPVVALERGRAFDLQGRYKEALDAYGAAIEQFPDHEVSVMAAFGVAEAYEQLGMLDEAEAAYYAVVDRHPNRSIVELKLRNLSNRRTRRDREPTVVIQRGRALKSRR